jgi:hypothetical protein
MRGLPIGWKNLLNADLIDEVLTTQVSQVSPLLIIRQVRANTVDHHHNERTIVHIHPVRATNEFIRCIADEGAIDFD